MEKSVLTDSPIHSLLRVCLVVTLLHSAWATASAASEEWSLSQVVQDVRPKIVKIYGAGGVRGLEAYQSGILISEHGHVLTTDSYVLDSDPVTIILDDGRSFEAEMFQTDPHLEIAVLKIDATDLSHFRVQEALPAENGSAVLAFSNLFGVATSNEPVSVMRGWISAITSLSARRGAFQSPYQGRVYVLDAITSNPGAAGGALTNRHGQLLGLLGRELRSSQNDTWLNYAIPIHVITESVVRILEGRQRPVDATDHPAPEEPASLAMLGIVLVPDVLSKTPPFIDAVRPRSPAEQAGLRPDDLVIFVNDRLVRSSQRLRQELATLPQDQPIKFAVMRGEDLLEFTLQEDNDAAPNGP